MRNRYKDAFTEVYKILEYLDEEDYNKIPSEVVSAIEKNRNEEYIFNIDWDIDLKDQILMDETRAILYNLFRDYFATREQREKIMEWQKEDILKSEMEKSVRFSGQELFTNSSSIKNNASAVEHDNKELMEYKKSIFIRIIDKIKRILNK